MNLENKWGISTPGVPSAYENFQRYPIFVRCDHRENQEEVEDLVLLVLSTSEFKTLYKDHL